MPEVRASFTSMPAAIRFFRRKVNVPTARWDDLQRGQHAHGFMVAGAARIDLLNALRAAVDAAVTAGETIEQFRARFADIQERTGFLTGRGPKYLAWRTRVIFDTNLRTAQMAGRYAFLTDPDVARQMPYWQYRHHTIDNPRLDHRAWDDLILPATDPWWRVHFPPNGWGCKCDVLGVSERKLRALRPSGRPDSAPAGGDEDVPEEWRYNVGEAAQSLAAFESLGRKVMELPPKWRNRVLADVRARAPEWLPDWTPFVTRIRTQIQAVEAATRAGTTPAPVITRNIGQPVGFLSASLIDQLQGRMQITTPGVIVTDQLVAHAIREAKALPVPAAWLDELPRHFARPDAVFLDADGRTLLVAMRLEPDRYAVAVVAVYQARRRAAGMRMVPANFLQTLKIWSAADFRAARAVLLEGRL